MRPEPGQVLHFSEDPTITQFAPHVAKTAQQPEAYVWAVDHNGGLRIHAVEYGWLEPMRTVALYAYRLAATDFEPFGEPEPHAHVAVTPVTPLGPPERVGNLFSLFDEAEIQLRVLPDLMPFWDQVITSSLGFSGIRLRNVRPAAAAALTPRRAS